MLKKIILKLFPLCWYTISDESSEFLASEGLENLIKDLNVPIQWTAAGGYICWGIKLNDHQYNEVQKRITSENLNNGKKYKLMKTDDSLGLFFEKLNKIKKNRNSGVLGFHSDN